MLPEELMEHEIEAIRKGFKYCDRLGTGLIKTEEVGNALRWIKLAPSEAEIKVYEFMADPERKGKIKFEQFLFVAAKLWNSDIQKREGLIWEAFLYFDKNDKGKLSVDLMKQILCEFGREPLTEKEAAQAIKGAIDPKDNTLVEYGYLIRQWQK